MIRAGMDNSAEGRESKRAFSTQRFPRGGYMSSSLSFREINTDALLSYDKQLNSKLRLVM